MNNLTIIPRWGAPVILLTLLVPVVWSSPDAIDPAANIIKDDVPDIPTLMRSLDSGDWDARMNATRDLGHAGYTNAGPRLVELLKNADDWRQVYASAESLGRLKVKEAVPDLSVVSETHWYPPVRAAALKALCAIDGRATYEPERSMFMDYPYIEVERDADSMREPGLNDVLFEITTILSPYHLWLMRLRYTVQERSYRPKDNNSSEMERYVRIRKVIPDVCVRVDGGYIVGRDFGEFGGELMFVGRHRRQIMLVDDNTSGLYRMKSGIVAVTGLGHLIIDRGVLYRITGGAGDWKAIKWKILPGAPRRSRLLPSGDLFVACQSGSVVVSATGEIRMATRSEEQAGREHDRNDSVLRLLVLLAGFVIVMFCGIALFLPYFRALPYRFLILAAGILPVVVAANICLPILAWKCGTNLCGYVVVLLLVLSLIPAVCSVRALRKNVVLSRGKRNGYLVFNVIELAGLLWACAICWMAASMRGWI